MDATSSSSSQEPTSFISLLGDISQPIIEQKSAKIDYELPQNHGDSQVDGGLDYRPGCFNFLIIVFKYPKNQRHTA